MSQRKSAQARLRIKIAKIFGKSARHMNNPSYILKSDIVQKLLLLGNFQFQVPHLVDQIPEYPLSNMNSTFQSYVIYQLKKAF